MNPEHVSSEELHAYVDNQLDAQRRIEVEAWLATHGDAARQVDDYRALQQRLHRHFDPVLAEHPGTSLPKSRAVFGLNHLLRPAMAILLMLASGLLGWSLKSADDKNVEAVAYTDLVQPAAFAHQVYSSDPNYPVEIPAIRRASLNQWVSKRMHTDLQAPDLAASGFRLIGGRLLPSTNRMAAQFMYEDTQGERLTIYIRRIAADSNSSFEYMDQDNLHIFYWINNFVGYAVVGVQPATRLIAVANAVNRLAR